MQLIRIENCFKLGKMPFGSQAHGMKAWRVKQSWKEKRRNKAEESKLHEYGRGRTKGKTEY